MANRLNEQTLLAKTTIGRATFYEFLSLLYIDSPKKSFLTLSEHFAPLFLSLGESKDIIELKHGAVLLAKFASYEKLCADKEKLLFNLDVQYSSLFALGDYSVGTTESINRTVERLNRQEPWEKVMNFYHIRNFQPPKSPNVPEDHIAIELLFMQQLCELIYTMIEQDMTSQIVVVLKEQALFMHKHLSRWVPKFCDEVIATSKKHGYILYQALGLLTKGYLESDSDTIDYLITNYKNPSVSAKMFKEEEKIVSLDNFN